MELHAYTRTISDLFSIKRQYVVPRFQREYSWEREQINFLWDDICENILVENGECKNQEYFIGALVLVGEDKSFEMQIVDGQQRLTTITIFLSALIEKFKEIKKDNIADAIYFNFIEGKDDNGEPYFKLKNETPKPFFQNNIQYKDKKNDKAETEEEKMIQDAYDEINHKLSKNQALSKILNSNKISAENDDIRYIKILTAVRDQILNYLKVIHITVKEEEEAYTIFETLNARGMNLSAVDLIKNEIFKNLPKTHPDDDAKTQWRKLRAELQSRQNKINIDTFFRHFWLSNYSFTQEGKIYREFKKRQKSGEIEPLKFLGALSASAKKYVIFTSPQETDWLKQEEKPLYEIFLSFHIFGVTQLRTLVLSLLDLRSANLLSLTNLIFYLEMLEKFHFKFTAVTSSRASGLEGKYSRIARELRELKNNTEVLDYLKNELAVFLTEKAPSEALFLDGIRSLNYRSHRVLIQYIFRKYERYLTDSGEIKPDLITLEHISSQSVAMSPLNDAIGNLLPISKELNVEAANAAYAKKIKVYKNSKLKSVAQFLGQYDSLSTWDDTQIAVRTEELSGIFYNKVWKLS